MNVTKFIAQILLMILGIFIGDTGTEQDEACKDWIATNAIEIKSLEMDSPDHDLQSLETIIGDARLVCLGESRHDAREQFLIKNRFVKYMVEELNFTNFMLEASMPYADVLNAYVLGRGGEIDDLMAGMPAWFLWDTEEMKDLIMWMREHNDKPGTIEKVMFYGIDIVAPDYGLTQIFDYLDRVDKDVLALFDDDAFARDILRDDFWPDTRQAYVGLTAARKLELKENYNELYALLEQNKDQYISSSSIEEYNWILRMGYCAREANLMFSEDNRLELGLRRDAAMADNALWIHNELSKTGKSIVWAHNVHIAKDEFTMSIEVGTIKGMGSLLKKELGDKMISIGASFNRGDYPDWGRSFPPADSNTVDGMFAQSDMNSFLLSFKDIETPDKIQQWFASVQVLRAQDFEMNCIPAKCFDAFYFVESITHTIPNDRSAERFRNM